MSHAPGKEASISTEKKRIDLGVNEGVYEALVRLSAKRRQPLAGVSRSLIEQVLEHQKGLHFSRVADEGLSRLQKRVAHTTAWE